jgi:hypothetical protein
MTFFFGDPAARRTGKLHSFEFILACIPFISFEQVTEVAESLFVTGAA